MYFATAALAVIEAVTRLPAREDLRVRLGIATGLAVVGEDLEIARFSGGRDIENSDTFHRGLGPR